MAYFDKYGVEYSDDGKRLITCPTDFNGEYVIPKGVTKIENRAFFSCKNLTNIIIPDSVTSIEEDAFTFCKGLTSINIGKKVENVGADAFAFCEAMTKVTINSNSLVKRSYSSDYNLENIFGRQVKEYVLGDDVTSIGDSAFFCCLDLTLIRIGRKVKNIGRETFFGCSSLTSIKIPSSVTSIGEEAFAHCDGLKSVTIGGQLKSIGDMAFSWCKNLIEIKVTKNNKHFSSVDGVLFSKGLVTLLQYPSGRQGEYNIPKRVKHIGEMAFHNALGLTGITIPNSVYFIGYGSFWGCSGLENITVEEGNSYYDSRGNCNAIIETYSDKLIVGCKNTIIPDSVVEIGSSAFSDCTGLVSIHIPTSVTSIGGSAFNGCSGLTSVTIPNSVTNIGDQAFMDCSDLREVNMGTKIKCLGEKVFGLCHNLKEIMLLSKTPPKTKGNTFQWIDKEKCTLVVQEKSIKKYKSAKEWADFNHIVKIFEWGKAEEKILIRMFRNDFSYRDIAKALGCSKQEVLNYLYQLGYVSYNHETKRYKKVKK